MTAPAAAASLRAVGATDPGDGVVISDLVEQTWQHWRVARGAASDLDGKDFQRPRIVKWALRH